MAMVSLQSCYDQARQSMAQGEYDRAEAICRHIVQYYPQDLGAFQLLGQINLERKQPRQARGYFRKVLEIDPENVSAHWGMGIAFQDEGSLEQAVAEFENALEIKPDLSDLRNQLLRVYAELYGASRAQLRLSRAGLGRLYVKGEMLDKAVEEFREVLSVDPSRVDVQLSLIEILWQSGQIEEAARVCEQVLEQYPNALKANLVLGYVRLNAGRQEEAEELWRRAASCDPNNTMARAIFEMAPMRVAPGLLAYDAATLPAFDEAAWLERQAAAEVAAVEEVPVPAEEEEGLEFLEEEQPWVAEVGEAEEIGLGASWLDSLATGEGQVEEVEEEGLAGVVPFSMKELGEVAAALPEEELLAVSAGEEEAAPAEAIEEEVGVSVGAGEEEASPFSLEDLGLSPEEIASLEEAVAAAREEGAAAGVGPAPEALEEVPLAFAEGVPAEFPASEPMEELMPGVEPFSLEGAAAPGPEGEEGLVPGITPFSVEPFVAEAVGEAEAGLGLPGDLKPFSLDELGLGEPAEGEAFALEEIEGVVPEEEHLEIPAFSWQEPGMRRQPAFREELVGEEEAGPAGPSLFEKMMAGRREASWAEEEMAEAAAVEERVEGVEPFAAEEYELEEAAVEEGAPVEGVEPFSLEQLGMEEVPGVEEAVEGLEPFSLEALGLEEAPVEEAAIEGVEPFSLEELGLAEPAAAGAEFPGKEAALEEVQPFSLEGLEVEAPEELVPTAEEAVPVEEALRPFTLEELGLTAEEMADLGLTGEVLAVEEVPPTEEAVAVVAEEVVAEVEQVVPEKAVAPEVVEEGEGVVVGAAVSSLDELRRQVAEQPADEGRRLALARACVAEEQFAEAVDHYKVLIKGGSPAVDDDLVADLEAWIQREEDPKWLHRLHRMLGDSYMKKGQYHQAINEYSWVLSKRD